MIPEGRRPIRSFVRREGRLTEGQRRALERLRARFGIEYSENPLDLAAIFGRTAPITLEIGFGNGETLVEMAAAAPERDFLGIEVHRPGVGQLLRLAEEKGLANLRVICHDAVEVLSRQIPPESLATVQIFFPDPWPKKRHHKRRLVQPAFVALLVTRLRPGGALHLATDWEDYALHMREVLLGEPALENTSDPEDGFSPRPDSRPESKFERRGQRLGHGVRDLVFRRRPRA